MLFEKFLLFLFAVQSRWNCVAAQRTVFSALSSMVEAMKSEQDLLVSLENYGVNRFKKLGVIKRVYDQWEWRHYETQKLMWKNKSDHLAKFKLLHRVTRHWRKLKTYFLDKTVEQKKLESKYNNSMIPQISDIRGFARLLHINADIYKKPLSDILAPRGPYVTIDEILELAFRTNHHSLGYDTYNSLQTTADLVLYGFYEFGDALRKGGVKLSQDRWEFLSSITDVFYESGLFMSGHLICKKIAELFPDDDEFLLKSGMFADRMSRSYTRYKTDQLLTDRDKFHWLCRRQELILSTSPELKCYYFHKNPHLRHFARYKVEEVSHSPVIRIYHDVLHNGEIRLMQDLVRPFLNTARVYNPADPDMVTSEDRISNSAWLTDPDKSDVQPPDESYLYRKVNQRMEDCTTLAKEGTEGIQVNNYGIGGHYLWHYDAMYSDAELDYYANDRVATWMFYLNDVKEGGNTVFPRVNISIPPMKGAAVFWYNLHSDGELDDRSLHGGCPILQGAKWVANLWVGEFPQIFIRKCLPRGHQEISDLRRK